MIVSRAINYALVLCALFAIGHAAVSNTFRQRAKTYCRKYIDRELIVTHPHIAHCPSATDGRTVATAIRHLCSCVCVFFVACGHTGLTKKCKLKEVKRYDYDLMKISDFPGMQPIGYLVRLQMYVLAPRDAHIVFSPIEKPAWTRDSVYEIRKLNLSS